MYKRQVFKEARKIPASRKSRSADRSGSGSAESSNGGWENLLQEKWFLVLLVVGVIVLPFGLRLIYSSVMFPSVSGLGRSRTFSPLVRQKVELERRISRGLLTEDQVMKEFGAATRWPLRLIVGLKRRSCCEPT